MPLPAASDLTLIRRNRRRATVEISTSPIHNRAGGVAGAALVLRDVTVTREITEQMMYRKTHDGLTGLPNRILAWDRLEQAISAAQLDATYVGILFLDIDRFKNLNDSLGYVMGDHLLEQVARRLQSLARTSDTVSGKAPINS